MNSIELVTDVCAPTEVNNRHEISGVLMSMIGGK